jgi:uncharacterized protein YkwD
MRQSFRRAAAALAGAVALSAAATLAPAPAVAFSTANGVRLNVVEARLTSLINYARTSRGLRALVVAPGTTDLAREWALTQAARNVLGHNPNLVNGIQTHGSASWHAAAENVGRGWDADSLFQAYMNSPGHRANILDPTMRYLGMGWVERPDGSGYNTQVFVDQYSTSYGRTRRPANGGLRDVRTPTSTTILAAFEGGWDARVLVGGSGGGLSIGGPTFDAVTSGDDGVVFRVRETSPVTGSLAELRLRDAIDLRNATGVRVRLSATTGTGRAVAVLVYARRELGSSVLLGTVVVPHGQTVTSTFPLPLGARNFRNAVSFVVTSNALNALSSTVSGRSATVRVRDVLVLA